MTRILLDTNAYSAFKKGDAEIVKKCAYADEIFLSVPVLAELRAGFKSGSKEQKNLNELQAFIASSRVTIPVMSEQTALFYAEIFTILKSQGTPIPVNDIWIAACTLEAGAVLITRDVHFQHIAGLIINSV